MSRPSPRTSTRTTRLRLHQSGQHVVESLEVRRLLATFFVTNTNDAGAGSLRAAIVNANATGIQDNIEFNFAAGGLHTIALASPLPAIQFATTIDGTTANGYVSTPLVQLNGAGAGAGAVGLDVNGNGTIIRALTINRFSSHGIRLTGNSSIVRLCYIGTDAAGLAALPNGGNGVHIDGDGNTVGAPIAPKDNVISGNNGNGVFMTSTSNGNVVAANYIGTDFNGNNAIPNALNGVRVLGSGNTIGGLNGTGNIISGNTGSGVFIDGCSFNVVGANGIGVTASTTSALPNGGRGVYVVGGVAAAVANTNTIGAGVNSSANNIHNNGLAGVEIDAIAGGIATSNLLSRNSLADNGGLGIDLIGAVNGSQGAPKLVSVTRGLTTIRATVSLSGAGFLPNQAYNVELFQSPSDDPSGFGEGLTYLISLAITTDGAGAGSAVVDVPATLLNLPVGRFISATCTNSTTSSTSEFSPSVELRDIEVFGSASTDKWSLRNDAAQTTLRIYPSADFSGTPFEFDKSLVDSITFHGGDGDDDVVIDLGNGDILPGSSDAFMFNGDNGTADTFHIQGSASNDVFSSGASAFTVGTNTYHYATIEAADLDGALGNDTFNIGNTNLTTYALATTIRGGGGTNDALTVADSSGSATEGYAVSTTAISNTNISNVPLFGGIIYDATLEGITISGGGGPSVMNVSSLAATTALTLLGNGGSDVIAIAGGNLDVVAGVVVVNGGGGTSDTVTLYDSLNAINDTYVINALSVTRPRFGGVTVSNIEALSLLGGTNSSIFNVTHNSSTTSLSVDTGSGTDTVNVVEANGTQPVRLIANAGADGLNVNSDNVGTAAVTIGSTFVFGDVNVKNGGTLTQGLNGSRLMTAKSLTVGATGKLDLNDNDLRVTNTPRATIENYVRTAYHFGDWLGAGGIFSTAARDESQQNTTLGLLSGQEFIDNNGGTFDGVSPVSSDVLIKYTYYGDIDFNGGVDAGDYNLIDFGFANHLTGWGFGDADYSGGPTDVSDYNVIDFAYATQGATL